MLAAPMAAPTPTPRLGSTRGTFLRWVTGTGTATGWAAGLTRGAATPATGMGVDSLADATGTGSGMGVSKSKGMTSRPASVPERGAEGAGTEEASGVGSMLPGR